MVKGEYYQIGEVSKITGISKDTLHFIPKPVCLYRII